MIGVGVACVQEPHADFAFRNDKSASLLKASTAEGWHERFHGQVSGSGSANGICDQNLA
jgi:hypothetical protein